MGSGGDNDVVLCPIPHLFLRFACEPRGEEFLDPLVQFVCRSQENAPQDDCSPLLEDLSDPAIGARWS